MSQTSYEKLKNGKSREEIIQSILAEAIASLVKADIHQEKHGIFLKKLGQLKVI